MNDVHTSNAPGAEPGEAARRKVSPLVCATTDLVSSILRKNSPLFWFALVLPVGIIALGINFLLNPVGASTGFGIPIHDPAAFPYMWTKGIRDIFSGLVILPFLLKGDRRTSATLLAIATFIPLSDGLVILKHLGFAPPLYMHWGTARACPPPSASAIASDSPLATILSGPCIFVRRRIATYTRDRLIPRSAEPVEIAQAHIHLLRGSYTTGQVLVVDQGLTLL